MQDLAKKGSVPLTVNVPMATHGTEYEYTLPEGTKAFNVKLRTADTWKINLGGVAGTISTTYIAKASASEHYRENLDIKNRNGERISFISDVQDANVAEIEIWQ